MKKLRRGTRVNFQWSLWEAGEKQNLNGKIDGYEGNDYMVMTENPKKIYQVPIKDLKVSK